MWKNQQSVLDWPSAEQLASFWLHLKGELGFRTLLYFKAEKCRCWIEKLLDEGNMTTTTLVWNNASNAPYLRLSQNVGILGLVCLNSDLFEPVLITLSTMLNHMREVPLLLQICTRDPDQTSMLEQGRQILKRCQDLLMPNVLLLLNDFFNTDMIYAYQMFPKFRLLSQVYHASLQLYPYKLANLHGQVIRTRTDLTQPYLLVYKDRNGKLITTGVLWRFMQGFARYLNATLDLSYDSNSTHSVRSSYFKLLPHIQNGTTDVTTSLFPLTYSSNSNLNTFSYPVIINSWCTMLPVERVVSPREAMTGVLESPWMWVYLGIVYCLIRHLYKRRMPGRPILTLLPSLIQLTLLCTVVAQLSALFIGPQKLRLISSWEQLNASGLKIIGARAEFNQYPDEIRIKYASSFISFENYTQFVYQRNSFNSSFGYTIYEIKWNNIAELQKFFKRPIFRYSTKLCVRQVSHNSVIFQENFLHRNQLDLYILWLRQSGILRFFIDKHFLDMLNAGYFKLQDLSTQVVVKPLKLVEMDFIVVLYGYAMAISLLIFVFELIVFYINVCLHIL
ncbi:uncharacterized protein LOC115771716 [Drosophila novamexicana]|uniref:uncharacterized protein LOC115771716 n=1 Tax=Drosophila novamexicana TaxID=47314 RepID=UPI0011E5C911|nr:uncharacterized protein LOC115771716 [Drosophila novamexicana]